eukprot:685978-Prorocentrum_minimum.AAC.1
MLLVYYYYSTAVHPAHAATGRPRTEHEHWYLRNSDSIESVARTVARPEVSQTHQRAFKTDQNATKFSRIGEHQVKRGRLSSDIRTGSRWVVAHTDITKHNVKDVLRGLL